MAASADDGAAAAAPCPPELGAARTIGLVVATLVVIALLGRFDPLALGVEALTGGGETVRMQPVRLERGEFDVDLGEKLLATLQELPHDAGSQGRVLVIGNSQQYTSSLPRGAQPDPDHRVEAALSRLGGHLEREVPGAYSVYVGAAPNQNFAEALWQGLYHFRVAARPPAVLVVQASFDTFRKTGIRPGFQTLLDDPAYQRALDDLLQGKPDRPWASELSAARDAKLARDGEAATKQQERPTLESRLRRGLEHVPLFRLRETRRTSFFNVLYLARVFTLGITPTTKRHIVGQPLELNLSSLEDLLGLAREKGALVLIYNAPVNPAVSMFFEDEYQGYLARLRALSAAHQGHFVDLADSVSAERWGYWIDGPDPIHFNEQGHEELGRRLIEAFGPVLVERAKR